MVVLISLAYGKLYFPLCTLWRREMDQIYGNARKNAASFCP
jgi:hypothetical protein